VVQQAIASLDSQIQEQLRPFARRWTLVVTALGIQQTVAKVVLSEIVLDIGRLSTVGHPIS